MDAQYYILNYHVHNKNTREKNRILKNFQAIGLVSITEKPSTKLAHLLDAELDVLASSFKFAIK